MGKGSRRRRTNEAAYRENFDRIFPRKEVSVSPSIPGLPEASETLATKVIFVIRGGRRYEMNVPLHFKHTCTSPSFDEPEVCDMCDANHRLHRLADEGERARLTPQVPLDSDYPPASRIQEATPSKGERSNVTSL